MEVRPEKVAVILDASGIDVKLGVTRPCVPGVLLMGIFMFEEAHVTDVVKS